MKCCYDIEATYVSINRLMDNNVVYILNRIILIITKKEILSFTATWIDLWNIILRKPVKDKYCMI